MMFAITAGALALARWQATGQRRWLLLAGILGGLAFAAKYTAAGAILGLATAVLLAKPGDSWEPVANVVGSRTETRSDQPRLPGWIRRWVHLSSKAKDVMLRPAEASPGTQRPFGRPQGDKSTPSLKCTSRRFRVLGPIILFVSGALLTILPWILKNYLLTGNPVYPFFLPGKFWDADRAWWYSRGGTGLPLERLLIAPWEMTVQGVEGASGYSATLGPLWLVLLPALLIAPAARRPLARQRLRLLLVITGVAYTVWLVQVGWSGMLVQSRLLLAIFPILACLAAAAFDHLAALSTEHLHTRWVIGAVVGLVLLFTGIETGRNLLQDNPLPVLGGSQSESDYLKYKLGWYTAVMEEINTLPEDSKVLFLWEPRSYYCRITCLPDALLDRWWHTRRMGATAVDIAAQWQALGVTHVLVYEFGRSMIEADGYDPLTPADWAEFTALRQHLTPLRDFDGVYQLYRFAAVNSHPDTGGPYTRYGNE
jgi:hypothetical protein